MIKAQKSGFRKFESIFYHSPIELANDELRSWRDCYEYVKKIIKNKSTLSEMTKVIQQDVPPYNTQLIKTGGHDDDMPIYTKLQVGLFYTSLICEERTVEDIMKIVQLINQDNFGIFLEKFNSVCLD